MNELMYYVPIVCESKYKFNPVLPGCPDDVVQPLKTLWAVIQGPFAVIPDLRISYSDLYRDKVKTKYLIVCQARFSCIRKFGNINSIKTLNTISELIRWGYSNILTQVRTTLIPRSRIPRKVLSTSSWVVSKGNHWWIGHQTRVSGEARVIRSKHLRMNLLQRSSKQKES